MPNRNAFASILVTFIVTTVVVSVVLHFLQPASGLGVRVLPLGQIAPAVGVLVCGLAFPGAIASMMPVAVSRRQVVAHLILGVVAVALYGGLLTAITAALGLPLQGVALVAGVPFGLALVIQVVVVVATEVGYRGLLQPLLERHTSRLLACIAVGLMWGVLHLEALVAGPGIAVGVIAASVILSILLGYLGNGSRGQRLVVTVLVHWLMSVVLLLIIGDRWGDLAATLANLMALGVTTSIFMLMFHLAQRRRAQARENDAAAH